MKSKFKTGTYKAGDFVKFYAGYGTIKEFAKKQCGLPWVKVWEEMHPVVILEFDRMGRKTKQKTFHIGDSCLKLADREQIEKFNP